MADSPRKRYSRSPPPHWEEKSRSRSRSRSLSRPRGRSTSRGRGRDQQPTNPGDTLYVTGLSTRVTERDLEDHFSKEGKSRRKRPRTPTPGHYLGLKNSSSRGDGYRGDRGGDRGSRYHRGYDDYGYRRSPRRSPYRGGRDYSPPRRGSPYGGGRDYSPRRSPPYGGGRDYSPPRRSPYGGGRSRREMSRSYSPYQNLERNYAHGPRI